jgi:hypothetical protein
VLDHTLENLEDGGSLVASHGFDDEIVIAGKEEEAS